LDNGHLSIAQIEELSLRDEPVAGELEGSWSHVEACEQCRGLVEKYRIVHAKFKKLGSRKRSAQANMSCPDERIWFSVAGGTLSPEEAMAHIQHAAICDSCSLKLRAATRMFEDDLSPIEETLDSLPSSNPNRQRELAEKLGQGSTLQQNEARPQAKVTSRSFWRRLFFYAIPATACVVAALMVSNSVYAKRQVREVQEFVDSEYGKGRPMYYRLAGMPYRRVRTERGATDLRPSIEISESVRSNAPRLAAETAFLEDDPSSAKAILEHARKTGDISVMTLNDLAVASAMEADRTRSQADYQKALALSEEVLKQHPDDATVYFNRALIFERLNRQQDARKALEQFQRFERDPGWLAEAEKMLDSL
jgi:tetratricopeptide (TPR) repeat protein